MGYFSRILNNCNETCILSLRNKEEQLSLKQKIEMKIHLRFCKCCQNFTQQSDIIDKTMNQFFEQMDNQPPLKASADFKAKMKEQLK
jgi:hypothetical protein